MKRSERRFYFVVGFVILILACSGIFASHEVFRLTENKGLAGIWWGFCFIFQMPLLLIPLDKGRTIGFIGRVLPQAVSLCLVAWNLIQIFSLLLAPILIFIPATPDSVYGILIFVFIFFSIVFRSTHRVVKREISLKLGSLPSHWEPLTILHISDIHSGPFMRFSQLEKIVGRFNKEKFDLCVVTGDVVNHSAQDLGWTLDLLEKINSRLGTYAIMGNHEYIDNEKEIIKRYRSSKLELLLGSSKIIMNKLSQIRLIGVDYPFEDEMTSKLEIEKALLSSGEGLTSKTEEFRILLSHHPNGFISARELGVPLTLSGHTHGGQIKFGRLGVARLLYEFAMGLYEHQGSYLFVNAGLGNWLPFRINVPCEYALITVER